ncbi:Ger(x)C family spore germination protein [Cohnella faecalis]|nr:hypothetical protein [Cohnella faecalis]
MPRRKFRPLAYASIVIMLAFQTGCWSSHEIETQSIYVGLAMDIGERADIEQEMEERSRGDYTKDAITETIQVLKPSGGGGESTKSGEQKKPYLNITQTGDSPFEILRELSLRTDRPPLGSHLKLIVIGSRLAQSYGLSRLLDFYLLDNDIRPSCLVFISNGRAAKTLETNVSETIPAIRILGITDNYFRNLKLLPPYRWQDWKLLCGPTEAFCFKTSFRRKGKSSLRERRSWTGRAKSSSGF